MILHKSPNLTEPQFNTIGTMLLLVKRWYMPMDKKHFHMHSSSAVFMKFFRVFKGLSIHIVLQYLIFPKYRGKWTQSVI